MDPAMGQRPTTDEAGDASVVDNPAQHRYEAQLDGRVVGISQYSLTDDVITFLHTEVDPSVKGLGIGSRLAAGALDDVRRRGLKVVATCPFIAAYIRRHSDYADLLAG
jgi:predicted GNAT family acetyltransferase